MNAILKPVDKVEARMIAYRSAQYKALEQALDDLILETDFKLDVWYILVLLQSALLKRQEPHTEIEPIYANIQLISDVINALHLVMKMDVEDDRLTDRATKLEHVKIDVARLRVPS